ncbi:uncharacterized protein NEMAJ01_1874 [Nematocida major]|uniref:uncharacterized protein n=1 Tax=Nematocida major TaxID=1912982 RepID=UPI002008C6C5|nr:uncharacterized protein NEMAJ01_1874 [Nematocida major]KAH9386978.1 hypothetical protein NEMAJ01_1874 [Nematocida major]
MNLEEENSRNPHIKEALEKALPSELSPTTEVEIRLGLIMEKSTQSRLSIKTMHPCVIERADTLWFDASVDEAHFKQMQEHFLREFKTRETVLMQDTLIKGMRRSEIKSVNGQSVTREPTIVKKKKLFSVDIFCPENKYDIRVGVSEEIVQKDTLGVQAMCSTREKNRSTYSGSSFVIDATEVRTGKNGEHLKTTFEVEIEAKSSEYRRDCFVNIVKNTISTVHEILK